ncbi:MAG: ABC transporter permease [Gordonia sp. (in: high G+C Gram-positive bacteria)]
MPGSRSNPSDDAGRAVTRAAARTWGVAIGWLVLRALIVTVAVIVAGFALLKMMPGTAVSALLGSHSTPAARQRLSAQLGLDVPWWEQLGKLFGNLLTHGDVGPSLITGESVRASITARAGITLSIVVLAMIIAVTCALVLAIVAATYQNRWPDHVVRVVLTGGIAVPTFWLGLLLILVFSVRLQWFPVAGVGVGADRLRSLVLPAITAAVGIIPVLARSLRAQLLEVMHADFIVAVRATGISRVRIALRHLVPNAAVPALTLAGTNLAYLVGGTFVLESVFTIPGVGDLMFRSIGNRDVTTIIGIVIYTAILVIVVNLATDVAVRLIDPRIGRPAVAR